MKVRVPVLIKDPAVTEWKDLPPSEPFEIEGEDIFLDGPVSRRVAIVDFEPGSGKLSRGARFLPADNAEGVGRYECRDNDLSDPAFAQVALFGGVHKTLAMFEEADTLGRRITWGFGRPQLLVVPRAGEWANAFYERDSHSLQFFYFRSEQTGQIIHASHSQDIIAHETAHAVIDGVAPDIYDAVSPQSLAIHEAMADIATLLMAFRSRKLAARVLEQTGGSLQRSNAFTGVGEQMGMALGRRHEVLRELNNTRTMKDRGLDRSEPHALSEVLSGALYRVMVSIYDQLRAVPANEVAPPSKVALKAEYEQWQQSNEPSAQRYQRGQRDPGMASGRALFIAGERFKRTVLRGLDYLPPGELTFADLGRAILASDEASHPDSAEQRQVLAREFHKRGIIASKSAINVDTNYEHAALDKIDFEELLRSDWAAYRFADRWRRLLGIPRAIPFEVRPRLDVTKTYYHSGEGKNELRELLFKVAWTVTERSRVGGGLPKLRRLTRGSTLAIDWKRRLVRAVVRSEPAQADALDRDAMVARLLDNEQIAIGGSALGPGGRQLRGVVRGDVAAGALRLRATARALHLLAER